MGKRIKQNGEIFDASSTASASVSPAGTVALRAKPDASVFQYSASGGAWTDLGGGGTSVTMEYRYQTDTAGAPASGDLHFDSTTFSSVTQIWISETTNSATDASAALDSLQPGDRIYVQEKADASKWIRLELTAATTDAGTYRTAPVTYVSSGSAIGDNAVCAVVLTTGGSTGTVPGGSATEIQYRSSATTFGGLTGSSVSGDVLTLDGQLEITSRFVVDTIGVKIVGVASTNGIFYQNSAGHVTAVGSYATDRVLKSSSVSVSFPPQWGQVNLASSEITGTLGVANGGTGLTAPGTAGNVLTSNGTAWISAAPPGGGTPGGSSGQLQYNSTSTFAGMSGSVVSGSDLTLGGNLTVSSQLGVDTSQGVKIFSGGNYSVYFKNTAGYLTPITYVASRVLKSASNTSFPPDWGQVNLTGGEITGTLGIANGGTALSSTPANGQLLIGNGTNYTLATLTAGTNVTITNGSGTITINASAGSTTPGGSGTELQYRGGASTFSALSGSSVSGSALSLTGSLNVASQFFADSSGVKILTGSSYAIYYRDSTSGYLFALAYPGAARVLRSATNISFPPSWAQLSLGPSLDGALTGTLGVANGGTGLTTPGTSGNVLTSNGSTWVSSAPAGGGAPGGSGTELQYRAGASTFGAVSSSSVSGSALTLGGALTMSAGQLTVNVSGVNQFLVNSAGAVGVKAVATSMDFNVDGRVRIASNSTDDRRFFFETAQSNELYFFQQKWGTGTNTGPTMLLDRARGTAATAGSGANVASGDYLGHILFRGYQSAISAHRTYAMIQSIYSVQDNGILELRSTRKAGTATFQNMVLGGQKDLTDNTFTGLFQFVFSANDQRCVGGELHLTIVAKQTTPSVYQLTMRRVYAFVVNHGQTTSTGAIDFRQSESTAAGYDSSPGGGLDVWDFSVNGSTAMAAQVTGLADTFTLYVRASPPSNYTTMTAFTAYWHVILHGECDLVPV